MEPVAKGTLLPFSDGQITRGLPLILWCRACHHVWTTRHTARLDEWDWLWFKSDGRLCPHCRLKSSNEAETVFLVVGLDYLKALAFLEAQG